MIPVSSSFRLGFWDLSTCLKKGVTNEFELKMTFVEAWIVAVWGLC